MTATLKVRELYGTDTVKERNWPSDVVSSEIHVAKDALEDACSELLASPLLKLSRAVQARVGKDTTITDAWMRRKMKAVVAVARDLMAKNRTEDALALLDLPQTKYDGVYLMTWARAAEKLAARKSMETALSVAAQELSSGNIEDERLEALLQRMEAQYGLRGKADFFAQRWVPITSDGLKSDMSALENLPAPKIDDLLLKWVYARRGNKDIGFADFEKRAAWGHNASQFIRDYLGALSNPEDLEFDPEQIKALRGEAAVICDEIDFSVLTDTLESGRSIVVTIAHVGFMNMLVRQFRDVDFPLIHIGANSVKEDQAKNDNYSYFLARGNVQAAFLKLIKRLRKEPAVVLIAPDGPYGSDMKDLDFLGTRIQLAQGAPMIAYHSKAKSVYLGSTWSGDKVAPYFREGPVPTAETDRDTWNDTWFEFYLNCMKEVVEGPPENMRLYSGIWNTIRSSLHQKHS